jgi:hypothetical protein
LLKGKGWCPEEDIPRFVSEFDLAMRLLCNGSA